LTLSELQELWLGAHPTTGSCFRTREELVAAWQAGRAVVMRLWGSHGRRPRGFYEFEWPGDPPAYDVERSTLWRAGVLGPEEKLEVEHRWRMDFDAVRGKDARAQREHFEWADIPTELVEAWKAERRRRPRRAEAPEKALDVASTAEGEERDGLKPNSVAAALE
jgi:hypothetical protein